jgi:hypothetical protein
MPRTRQAIAQRVADRLFAAESAIDLALTRAAELNASMPEARADARLPAMIGMEALDKAAGAFAALVEARRRMVEAHQSLDATRAQIGLKEVAAGDLIPKPAPALAEASPLGGHLRAVG